MKLLSKKLQVLFLCLTLHPCSGFAADTDPQEEEMVDKNSPAATELVSTAWMTNLPPLAQSFLRRWYFQGWTNSEETGSSQQAESSTSVPSREDLEGLTPEELIAFIQSYPGFDQGFRRMLLSGAPQITSDRHRGRFFSLLTGHFARYEAGSI
jgi:hypothetical protein